MANQVASTETPLRTERWSIPFCHVPEMIGNCQYTDGEPGSKAKEYGRILDTVYEMADQIATSNRTRIEDAIDHVCKTEGWYILPKHRRLMATVYMHENEKLIRLEVMINAKHLFEIGTQRGERKFKIEVRAGTRRAAARMAHENGFVVNDVNMVG